MDTTHETYLNPREVASRLGMTTDGLAHWRWKGTGPTYVKLGRQVRYPESELRKWIADRTTVLAKVRN